MEQRDIEFMQWWERRRESEGRFSSFIRKGIGMGLMMSFPVVLAVIFRGWYKRMPFVSGTQLFLVITGCIMIAVFYAVFKGRMKWEENESRYLELKKRKRIDLESDSESE